jgi:hypothetical protein
MNTPHPLTSTSSVRASALASASATASPVAPPGSLTPEGILAYCAMQLGSLDEEIKGKMVAQQAGRTAAGALTAVKSRLATGSLEGNADPALKREVLRDLKKAYDALPPNDPQRREVEHIFQKFATTACTNDQKCGVSLATLDEGQLEQLATAADVDHDAASNYVDTEELKDLTTMIDGVLGGISKSAEIAMIEIQSAVSRRQQAVQFATNILSKYNDGLQSVVANLGK